MGETYIMNGESIFHLEAPFHTYVGNFIKYLQYAEIIKNHLNFT
jgi:hypothetical protein